MIVLLPVSRYRVHYQVASGRPYSFFERFILEAIGDQHTSLKLLESTFRVHRRVLIEAVVTLIQAGWVAIQRDSHELVLTKSGSSALGHQNALPKGMIIVDQTDYLVGERVQGQVAKGSDVTFSSKGDLRSHSQSAAVMPSMDIPHPLDPGLLVPLIRISDGEWIRSCGPVDIVRDGADYVVVDVNTGTGQITGIPVKWVPLLKDDLIDRARAKERQLIAEGFVTPADTALLKMVRKDLSTEAIPNERHLNEWNVDPRGCSIFSGNHLDLLESWIETARSYLLIVTGTLDFATVKRLEPALRAAIERGILVDIMWDSSIVPNVETSHSMALELLKKIEYDSRHSAVQGRLAVARKGTGSNARILLGDVGGGFEAVVGSCEWLSWSPPHVKRDLSLLFRVPGIVARIARIVADVAASDENLSNGIGLIRLKAAAEELDRHISEAAEHEKEERAKSPTPDRPEDSQSSSGNDHRGIRVRLIVGREHHVILPTLATTAERRFVIAGRHWGDDSAGALKALATALEKGCSVVEAHYGVRLGSAQKHEEAKLQLLKLGGEVRENTDLNARIAVVDEDTAVVSSCDWLCPDLSPRGTLVTDIGFLLRGNGIGEQVLECTGIRTLSPPVPPDGEYITQFRIENLRGVARLEWQLEGCEGPGWHVLVGDNGAGKTSILRALALALVGQKSAQTLPQKWGTWIRGDEERASIELRLHKVSGNNMSMAPSPDRVVRLEWDRNGDVTALRGTPEEQEDVMGLGYGPFRRFSRIESEHQRQLSSSPTVGRYVSLFDDSIGLAESLVWLRDLQFKKLENDQEAGLLLDRITKLVNQSGMFPIGIELAEITSESVAFRDEYGFRYSIDELSDGYRSVLSLAFDMIRQLSGKYGAARVFSHDKPHIVVAPGIVLIDEVDAHLHPSWQRTIGQWFRIHFPQVQFIVATHSPLVCQAAEGGSVYRLPNQGHTSDVGQMLDGSARARLIYGNILEALESGAFGEEVSRSESSKELLRRLAELNRKEVDSGLTAEEGAEQERLRSVLPLTAHRLDSVGNES